MEIEHLDKSLFLAARLVEGREYDEALTVLRPLIECELSAAHKGIVCVNMAIICGLQGQPTDALAWYDRGINYDRYDGRFFVTERKAAYLAELGWTSDSLTLYRNLRSEPSLTVEDIERIEGNIALLEERLGR